MEVLQHTDKEAMRAFVDRHAHEDATVYTDGASAYIGDRVNHETVAHTPGDYVSGRCPHERDRVVLGDGSAPTRARFAGGGLSTMGRMGYIVTWLVGKRLTLATEE